VLGESTLRRKRPVGTQDAEASGRRVHESPRRNAARSACEIRIALLTRPCRSSPLSINRYTVAELTRSCLATSLTVSHATAPETSCGRRSGAVHLVA